MFSSLLGELLGDARRFASVVVILLAAVYISGFLIVNTHLGQYGIVRFELVQARFIAAGVLYTFIAGVSGLFVFAAYLLCFQFVEMAAWLQRTALWEQYLPGKRQDDTKGNLADQKEDEDVSDLMSQWLLKKLFDKLYEGQSRKGRRLIQKLHKHKYTIGITLSMIAALLLYVFFHLSMRLCRDGTEFVLTWLSGESALISPDLIFLIRLEGLGMFFVLLLYDERERLHRSFRRPLMALALVLFVIFQGYGLVWFANEVYSELPRHIGGGKPVPVQFFADEENLLILSHLGIPTDAEEGRTGIVRLLDEVRSESGSTSTYAVLGCEELICPAIEFDGELIDGLVYDP